MLRLKRTNSENPDFEKLVVLLDAVLRELDGDDHAFYAQFNKTNFITEVVVAYETRKPWVAVRLKNMMIKLWKSKECMCCRSFAEGK